MTRVFRTTNDRYNRLDANGNSILDDGEGVSADLEQVNGKMVASIKRTPVRTDDPNKGDDPMSRNDSTDPRTDAAVEAYARAIAETDVRGRNLWHGDLPPDLEPDRRDDTKPSTDNAVDNYARAIEEAERGNR